MRRQRLEHQALLAAALSAAVGVAASVGWIPRGRHPALLWLAAPLLLALGLFAGWLLALRGREAEERSRLLLADPGLTAAERELARRDAEAEHRAAPRVCGMIVMGPTFAVVAWLRDPERLSAADGLWLPALLGFAVSAWWHRRRSARALE